MLKKPLLFSILFAIITIHAQQKTKKLQVGDKIPHFSLIDQYGKSFDSMDYLNKQALVIFFYPKASAPVCTAQACSFRDNQSAFNNLNAKIVGISPDYIEDQQDFTIENRLPYSVLSDKDNRIRKKFGVPTLFLSSKPKRYTFVIDKYGIIQKIFYSKKDIEAHINQSLATLTNINNEFSVQK